MRKENIVKDKPKNTLGIIGFGQFSCFFIPYLKPYFSKICVSSRSNKRGAALRLGVDFVSNREAARQDVVMLSVPISQIENVLREIKNEILPGTLVMDVCSVKVYPVKLMKRFLGKKVNIIGTHPLFGPQSGKRGIKGLEIVICPARVDDKTLKDIRNMFLSMSLKVILTTPTKHDKIMASTQALTHFFAKGVIKTIDARNFEFSTPSSRKLFDIINDVREDSPALFRDIETLNPYSKSMRKRLLSNFNKLNKKL